MYVGMYTLNNNKVFVKILTLLQVMNSYIYIYIYFTGVLCFIFLNGG